ncbi:hypothetical protein DAI22_11g233300 [Oryza sativa Japonica Group]|nr:hypothetical protein DAI22_11g233300 [Oryza sativa Japonica Group]
MILTVLLILGCCFFLFFLPMAMVAAQPWMICGSSKYAANSIYKSNLDSLLSSFLEVNGDSSGLFGKGMRGAAPDTVYAVALCRGDVNASACSDCVYGAFAAATTQLSKDATVFYDECLIRFSDKDEDILNMDSATSFNTSAVVNGGALILMNITSEPMLPGWGTAKFTQFFRTMLNDMVIGQVLSTTRHYAAIRVDMDDADASNTSSTLPQRLFCLAQCAPDLIEDICYSCLTSFSDLATANFAGRQGGRILGLRCSLRYDTNKFFAGEPTWSSGSSSNALVPSQAPQPAPLLPTWPKHKKPVTEVLVPALVAPLLALFICVIASIILRRHLKGKTNADEDEAQIWGLQGRSSEFSIYDFSQVLEATDNFSEENKLGQGGFGPVYKGRFPDGVEIAVKRLASHSGQGLAEFKNEIQLIAKLQHTNLVRLLGCCYQRQEKILIYEYLPNKSLDFFIFDETRRALIDWHKRLAIIDGIAQGLLYLHKHSRLRVIHRDLKAGNILLDREMNPKIADFGLAKIFSTNDTEGNTKRIVGTYGYMAPEYASEGLFSIKSDVFSFGVLILEIVRGKRTSSFHRYGEFINLLGHAWQMWKDETWLQLVDPLLPTDSHTIEIMRCINIALLCVQENAADRPTTSEVVAMLSNETMTLPEPKHPAFFNMRLTNEEAPTVVAASSVNDSVQFSCSRSCENVLYCTFLHSRAFFSFLKL